MSKKMLINMMHPEEARVAIVEDGRLVELDIEIAGSEQTRGNIYKGVVVRVEPGLQAAFIDIGQKKLGFLQMGELHPDFWQWRDDIPEENRKRRPRIQEVLRRGQELIVQVEKGERDSKGAALTSYLSLPGRYMVIMPGSDSTGISRKVESESERKKLKETVGKMEIPEGIGYIIRTEALGKTKTELTKDLHYLVKLYESIKEKAGEAKAPALIYQESDLVIRTIRDYFTAEIDEVLVDSKEVHKQARAFFKATMPKYEKLVKLHQEKRPIFSKYQLEEQIDLIYEKKVPLKSGGSIVIEPTEALVSIDVNSGKSTGEKGVEDTAFKTNLEAAEEAARQLRLRDLGGLIVIDFIDMRDRKHMAEVEKTLKNALKADKARVTVGKISQFGILEMSRQRIKPTLEQAIYLECPHCSGRGKVKSVENMALSFLRKVHAAAAKGTVAEVRGGLPLEVAYYLLNRKKRELAQIENDYDMEVTVKGKTSLLMNQLELELVKRERPPHVEVPSEAAVEQPAEEPLAAEESAGAESVEAGGAPAAGEAKKKKRRRGKKKPKAEGEVPLEPLPVEGGPVTEPTPLGTPSETTVGQVAPTVPGEEVGEHETHPEESKKKRRRRKRRGAKGAAAEGAGHEAAAEQPMAETTEGGHEEVIPSAEPAGGEHPPEEAKKKRRRRRRRGGKRPAEEATSGAVEHPSVGGAPAHEPLPVEVPVPSPVQEEKGAAPIKRARTARKKAVEPAEEAAVPVSAEAAPVEGVLPQPAKRARRKKDVAGDASVQSELPVTGDEAPKRKRAPRKKKESPEE